MFGWILVFSILLQYFVVIKLLLKNIPGIRLETSLLTLATAIQIALYLTLTFGGKKKKDANFRGISPEGSPV